MIRKPPCLQAGDTVAAVSLSSGLAAQLPDRYAAGKRQLEEAFGLKVIEAPNALASNKWLYRHPEARAADLHWAMENPDVRAIVSTIGGDDSVRLLPYLDLDLIRAHPKILLGFSDTTVALTAFFRAGVVSFYGPSLMTDFAEHGGIRPFVKRGMHRALFESQPFELEAAETWTEEFADWGDPVARNRVRQFEPNEGWVWLQGDTRVEGRLIGGCAEVLEILKGTPGWPAAEMWDGAVLVLETSELVPSPTWVGAWLRNYGAQGILEQLSALLIGRPYRYTPEMKGALYDQIRAVLAEFARSDLPVVANMDFGHTSPQMVLPLGCRAAVDPMVRRIEILEAPTAES